MTAYTYYLLHKPTGKKYYGVRWASKVSPENDLWIRYFSSSRKVKRLIKTHGKGSFEVEIRKQFTTKEDAILWEQTVLRRLDVRNNPMWLNQVIQSQSFFRKWDDDERHQHSEYVKRIRKEKPVSEETRKRQSYSARNRPPISELTREKIGKIRLGKPAWNRGLEGFGKGAIPWNKGKKMPLEKQRRNYKHSEETKRKISDARKRSAEVDKSPKREYL